MKKQLNYFLYRMKYRYGKFLKLKTPVDISLELSSRCNMICSYCYHNDKNGVPFDKKIMDLHTASKIIEQGFDLNVPSIKFNYRGESTMNPHFKEIVTMASDLNKLDPECYIDRISNSNFKFPTDRNDIFEGLSTLTKIKVSYDSFNKEVFEKQRLGGSHELTTRNIDKFYKEYYNPENQELVIQAVITKDNEYEDLEAKLRERWPFATLSVRPMVDGRKNESVVENTIKERDFSNRQSCLQAFVRLIFRHDGSAGVCCPDIAEKFAAGSIHDSSLYEIFNNEKVKQLRKDLKTKKAFERDPCKNCSSYESFTGYKHPWGS